MSSAAAASSSSPSASISIPNAEDLTCPSCQCIIAHPLRLNCAHHLCKECVKLWTQHSRDIAAKVVENSVELLGLNDADLAKIDRNPHCKLSDRCDFCQLEESENNALVWCDRCPAVVHQGCYQISQMPAKDEEWFCDPCFDTVQKEQKERKKNNKASPQKALAASGKTKKGTSAKTAQLETCCVCNNTTDRVMKRVAGGGYIHLSCASFLDGPDFVIKDNNRVLITNVSTINLDWFKLSCKFCTKKNGEKTSFGAKVQCRYKKCCTSYHVPCGLQNGALFSIKELGEHIYKDNVCVVHRKYIREIANAHDEKLAPAKNKKSKGKARKQKPKGVQMPCPVCRNESTIVLGKDNLGLEYDEAMAQQAKAYREAHPDEDDDLEDVLAKYPKSRGHDGSSSSSSSSSESEEEKEEEEEGKQKKANRADAMEDEEDSDAVNQLFRSSQEEADLAHPDRRKSPRKQSSFQPSRQSSTASSVALASPTNVPQPTKSRLQKRASAAFTPPLPDSNSPSPPTRVLSQGRASPASGASSPRKRASTPLTATSSSLERLSSPSPSPSALKPKKLISEDDTPFTSFLKSPVASFASSKPLAVSLTASSTSNGVTSLSPLSGKRARQQPASFKDSINFMDIESDIDDSTSEEDEDAYVRHPKKKSRLAVTPQPSGSQSSDSNKHRAPSYIPDMRRSHSDPELQSGLDSLLPKPKASPKYEKHQVAASSPALPSKNNIPYNPLSSSKMPVFSPRKTLLELEEDGLEILDFKVPQPFKKSSKPPVVNPPPVPSTAAQAQAKYKALFGLKTGNTSPEIQPVKSAYTPLPLSKVSSTASPSASHPTQVKSQQLLRQQQLQLLQPASMRKQSVPLPMKKPSPALPLPTSDSDSEDFDHTATAQKSHDQHRAFIKIDSTDSSNEDEEMN